MISAKSARLEWFRWQPGRETLSTRKESLTMAANVAKYYRRGEYLTQMFGGSSRWKISGIWINAFVKRLQSIISHSIWHFAVSFFFFFFFFFFFLSLKLIVFRPCDFQLDGFQRVNGFADASGNLISDFVRAGSKLLICDKLSVSFRYCASVMGVRREV